MIPFLLVLLFLVGDHTFALTEGLSARIYDGLVALRERTTPPPAPIHEIVLVGIDSKTLGRMKEKWPYSRETFARVLGELQESGARAIGLDLAFLGDSHVPEEDLKLREIFQAGNRVILGSYVKPEGGIQFSTLSGISPLSFSGIVNKFQDPDGVTRSAPTYLVHTMPGGERIRFFSWEMNILNAAGAIDLSRLVDHGKRLSFGGDSFFNSIPVDSVKKTFPISFRAHTGDFERLSFSDVLEGRFDRDRVRDKIVLVGFLSEILQDLHRTPIGWMPGLTVNANALLTLLARDFMRPLPWSIETGFILLGALVIISFAFRKNKTQKALLLGFEIFLFLMLSYGLLLLHWTWLYARIALALLIGGVSTGARLRFPRASLAPAGTPPKFS